jgi:4-amino-4-deoxychorismate lyase
MFQFIESIRIKDGCVEQLGFHQTRVNKTFLNFGKEPYFQLHEIINLDSLITNGVAKCRKKYDLDRIIEITYSEYAIRKINTISLAELDGRKYDFKYADRDWISDLLLKSGTDEIIMTDEGIVKDASYANLAFYDGELWYTPQSPLLEGTQRAFLLETQKIHPREISVNDLHKYQQVKLINAMMSWDESPILSMALLS